MKSQSCKKPIFHPSGKEKFGIIIMEEVFGKPRSKTAQEVRFVSFPNQATDTSQWIFCETAQSTHIGHFGLCRGIGDGVGWPGAGLGRPPRALSL